MVAALRLLPLSGLGLTGLEPVTLRFVSPCHRDQVHESLRARILRAQWRSRLRPLSRVRQSSMAERPALQNTASRLGMGEFR